MRHTPQPAVRVNLADGRRVHVVYDRRHGTYRQMGRPVSFPDYKEVYSIDESIFGQTALQSQDVACGAAAVQADGV